MHSGWVRSIGGAIAGGLVVGMATSIGQGVLPEVLAPLANSSTSWSLAAFLLAVWLGDRQLARGALCAGLALLAMLAGYDLVTIARGFSISVSMGLFWAAAAVVVGPALGVGAAWVRGEERLRIAAGIAPIAGIAVGEGAYGLTVIAATTPAAYWIAQIALALGGIALVGARTRSASSVVVSIVLTALVAAVFFVGYSSL